MTSRLKKCLFLLAAAFVAANAGATVDGYTFRQYSPSDVLPSRIITTYQAPGDCNWFGTFEGLVRLDNYDFHLYKFDPADENSLPGNTVYQVVKDEIGNTWIMTDGGLAIWNRHLDNFSRLNYKMLSALTDGKGCFFGATDTLFRFDNRTQKIEVAATFPQGTDFAINSIFQWTGESLILFCKEKGAYVFEPSSGRLDKIDALQGKSYALFVDSHKHIWRSVFGKGVECYNTDFIRLFSYDTSNSGISCDVICCFCEYDGQIWMGADGGGISIYNPIKRNFTVLKHDYSVSNSLPGNTIITMFPTSGNLILAGRSKGGLVVINKSQISSFNISDDRTAFSCPDGVCSIFNSSNNQIWLGTDGSGLVLYDCDSHTFKHYPHTIGAKVISMAELPDGKILFYNYPKGFYVFDKAAGTIRPFSFGYEPLETGNTAIVQEVSQGSGSDIFIHNDKQLFRYNSSAKAITELRLPKEITGYGSILQSVGGQQGRYFHNTRFVFTPDMEGNGVRTLIDAGADVSIVSVSVDKAGRLWLATSKGLGVYDISKDVFRLIESDFIKSAQSVLCDTYDRVWVGTKNDLYLYNINNNLFSVIDDLDGLSFDQFMPKPRLVTADGDLIMGSECALCRIDRNFTPLNDVDPVLSVTNVSVDGKMLTNVEKFNIPASHKEVLVSVFARSMRVFNKGRMYRFRISGPDGETVHTKNVPSLALISLKPGRYQIFGNCSSKNAKWTEDQLLTTFVVKPHWYEAWWFIILLIMLIVAAVVYMYRNLTSSHNRRIALDALRIQHQNDEQKLNFLVKVNHELRTPLTLIEGPLQRIIDKTPKDDANYPVLKSMARHTTRIKYLLNTILTAKSTVGGTSKLNIESLELNKSIRMVAEGFAEEAQSREVDILFDLDTKIGNVDIDPIRSETVLSNFIMNALVHSAAKSAIQIRSELLPDADFFKVYISDRGASINEEDFKKLFNREFSSIEECENYSIALPYARNIVQAMGGDISATNNPGGGTTFCIKLPTRQDGTIVPMPSQNPIEPVGPSVSSAQQPSSVPTVAMPAAPAVPAEPAKEFSAEIPSSVIVSNQSDNTPLPVKSLKDASILIVEDDADLRNYLLSELNGEVRTVFAACNGVEAVKFLHTEKIDVVVSDIMMPEMDGYTLCRYIKTTLIISHLPVILLTARTDENSRLLGYKNGADEYLTKPFDLNTLMHTIEKMFLSRELMRQRFASVDATPQAAEATFSPADEIFMKKFEKVINDNISNPDLDVKFIVDSFATSRTVLFNKVKQLTGMNLQNYINKCRMDYVINLMKTTSLPLADIAKKSGFASPRYFSTSFKNYTGMTPSQYKKEKINNN